MSAPPSEDDFKLALKVFDRAIEFFQIPNEVTPDSAHEFIREDGTIDFARVPLVTVRKWEDGTTYLNIAYFYDGILVVAADYNPVVAILGFLDEARQLLRNRFPGWSEDNIEKHAEIETTKMTFMMFSKFYPRMKLAMENITSEAIHFWYKEWLKWEAKIYSESGIKPMPISETKLLRGLLKEYGDDILKLWLDVPDRSLEEKKMQLAKEYPSILNHWQKLRAWCRNQDTDWREYAKAGRFLDTPDDLLNKLENSDEGKMSYFALEHAARRAGLLKLTQDNKILEKRAQQIKVTGYTPRQLRTLLKEGEKLLGEIQSAGAFHSNNETDEPQQQG